LAASLRRLGSHLGSPTPSPPALTDTRSVALTPIPPSSRPVPYSINRWIKNIPGSTLPAIIVSFSHTRFCPTFTSFSYFYFRFVLPLPFSFIFPACLLNLQVELLYCLPAFRGMQHRDAWHFPGIASLLLI
jgi:hypothetical protein